MASERAVDFEVVTSDRGLRDALRAYGQGDIATPPEFRLEYRYESFSESAGIQPQEIALTVFFTGVLAPVALNMFSTWLYNRLSGKRVQRLTISRRTIELDRGQIKRVVEETITREG